MTAIMLDWITARVPCDHLEPILGGRVLKISPEGQKVWEVATRLEVIGSYDTNLYLRTIGVDDKQHGLMLEISGNPTKFLQGHNLFGGLLLPSLLIEVLMPRLCELLPSLSPSAFNFKQWQQGAFELLRVDLTAMYQLESRASVRAWLRAAEHLAYLKNRGRGSLVRNGTLYFGQHSRRWSLKLYSKGDELEAGKEHQISEKIPNRDNLLLYADCALRCELVIRSMELKRRGLRLAANWVDDTAFSLLRDVIQGLSMNESFSIPVADLDSFPARLRLAYQSWLSGVDLRSVLSRPTFYRYRSSLLPYGIDIAVTRHTADRSNVIPLIRVLEAVPMSPPDWARGTSLLVDHSDVLRAREARKLKAA